jgi:hypothetical protein
VVVRCGGMKVSWVMVSENAIARGDRSVYVCVSYLIRATSMHYMKSICMFEDDVLS